MLAETAARPLGPRSSAIQTFAEQMSQGVSRSGYGEFQPKKDIPWNSVEVVNAATTDVPVMQFVLPSSASSRHSAANDER